MSFPAPPPAFFEALDTLGLSTADLPMEGFVAYLERLFAFNAHTNVTAVREPEKAWEWLILDAVAMFSAFDDEAPAKWIDIGSGGGLPAIPLALARPDVRLTLVEARGKKARFLRETAEALGLSNTRVLSERAEDLGQDGRHRQKYDLVTARAVAAMPTLLELTTPLLRVGGALLAPKGQKAEFELVDAAKAMHVLGAEVEARLDMPAGVLVLMRKVAPTPKRYPRLPGEPKRKPIGS